MTKWKIYGNPFLDFTKEITQEWIEKGFSREQTKEWLNIGLKAEDSDYAYWLRNIKKKSPEKLLNNNDDRELRKEYELNCLTIKEKEETERENTEIEKQKNTHKDYEENHQDCAWIEGIGMVNIKELMSITSGSSNFSISFPETNSISNTTTSKKTIKTQEWLDKNFPKEENSKYKHLYKWQGKVTIADNQGQMRQEIKELEIWELNLEGELDLSDFVNLESLDCAENKLTGITLTNCPKLLNLNCKDNQLTKLDLSNNKRLKWIYCAYNLLTDTEFLKQLPCPEKVTDLNISNNDFKTQSLDFLKSMKNLEWLDLGNYDEGQLHNGTYNRFCGSLEPLKNMSNLKTLNIDNTDIESGLEYLSDSIEDFCCSSHLRNDAKCQNICDLLVNEQGLIETDKKWLRNFPQRLLSYKDSLNNNEIEQSKKNNEIIDDKQLVNLLKKVLGVDKIYLETEQFHQRNWDYWGFTYEESQEWVQAGLAKWDYDFANYLKNSGFAPQQYSNFASKDVQTFVDYFYPKEKRNEIIKLDIYNKSLTGSLKIHNFNNLQELDCSENQITNIEIINCSKLTKISLNSNQLTSLSFLNSLSLNNLTSLSVGSNQFPPQDLSLFSCFINLEIFSISGENFFGSLQHLKNMNKLRMLSIENTNIDSGLEHLPESLIHFSYFDAKNIEKELKYFVSRDDELSGLEGWREINRKKIKEVNKSITELIMVPLTPPKLLEVNAMGKLKENFEIKEMIYSNIYPDNSHLWKKQLSHPPKILPSKVYRIEENKIDNLKVKLEEMEKIKKEIERKEKLLKESSKELRERLKELEKDVSSIKNYAIVSYFWGDGNDESIMEKAKFCQEENGKIFEKEVTMTRWGRKALSKALYACKSKEIDIGHLWMDQLCINQGDKKEKSEEIPKMGQYYNNAEVTLISINANICDKIKKDQLETNLLEVLKIILRSKWFSRSWTYQEGWLSKKTIFMFDDILVDGRTIAGAWVLHQSPYVETKFNNYEESLMGLKKIATPVGWVYYKKEYSKVWDKVDISLSQALRAIKTRKRSIPIDGIYSILGLLRYYGKQLKIDYSLTPEQALFKLMKVATKYGRGEPLSWFGEGSDAFGLCWMPKIDEYGSTSVEGGIDIHFNDVYKKNIIFEEKFIKFIGEKYIIEYIKESNRIENNFEVGSEFYERNVEVRPKKKKDVQKKNLVILTLLGIKKTIESIKKNDILIIPDREILVKNPSFALLVEKTEQENVYHRLGLVELDSDKLKVERNSEEVIIGSKFYTEIFNVIEVPPKYSLF